MPPFVKPWAKYPPNTSTPWNDVTARAQEARLESYTGAQNIGTGVNGYGDFKVSQTGVASMVLNVGSVAALNSAFISWDANGSSSRYEYSGTQLTVNVTTADPTNPRIDRVILTPTGIDTQTATPSVLPGTPTAGATLENLNGAPVVPVGSILLADVIVAAAATSIAQASIRDRRAYPSYGASPQAAASVGPGIVPPIDQVPLVPHPLQRVIVDGISTGLNNFQSAAAVYLPRRIVGANRIRWAYGQSATAVTGNYNFGIMDAQGYLITSTGVVAIAGAANSYNVRAEAFAAQTLEAGWYHLFFGVASIGATGSMTYWGMPMGQSVGQGAIPSQNIGYARNASGTTIPANLIVGGLQDVFTLGTGAELTVPVVCISVG